jgi:hypothetical protein
MKKTGGVRLQIGRFLHLGSEMRAHLLTAAAAAAVALLGGFTFNAGAPAYSFSIPFPIGRTLTFNGAGIINDSSNAPSFSLASGSLLNFTNSSTAGNAIITTAVASNLNFWGTSSADAATITNGGVVFFNNSSSAGAATISNLTGGLLDFFGNSTAANATTIINSGSVAFFNTASGGPTRRWSSRYRRMASDIKVSDTFAEIRPILVA